MQRVGALVVDLILVVLLRAKPMSMDCGQASQVSVDNDGIVSGSGSCS